MADLGLDKKLQFKEGENKSMNVISCDHLALKTKEGMNRIGRRPSCATEA